MARPVPTVELEGKQHRKRVPAIPKKKNGCPGSLEVEEAILRRVFPDARDRRSASAVKVDATGAAALSIKTSPVKATVEMAILDRAVDVIGDKSEALRWMGTPIRALDYATPISLIATAPGRKSVLSVLDKLEHGVL